MTPAGRAWSRPVAALGARVRRASDQMRVRHTLVYANLAVLGQRHGFPPGLAGHELKVFSQNGEDGVLGEIFDRIGTGTRWFVEFGIGAGLEGNSVLLADVAGWDGLFIEGSPALGAQLREKYVAIDRIRVTESRVTVDNVEGLFAAAGVPTDLDLLTVDIDGNDYWVWQAVTRYQPAVVVIEYNGAIDPAAKLVQPHRPDQGWDGTTFYGASLGALDALGTAKGYRLVHTDLTGTNAFFVRHDHAHHFEDCQPVPARRASFGFTDFRHKVDPHNRSYVVVDP